MGIFTSKRTDKVNIVLVHGFWADGSGWTKVIPTFRHKVILWPPGNFRTTL
ncbi:hypothetical protein KDH_01160 [Dictyobacter sp. S3.2.2.5]|uniref:AB hydrolase-1 domain-containing protein n=1 Tax=Dictyobacter halimunensis TaxID=3026934 RepID=A0ABQ6FLD9_9CHLR|nr:hypothetical protein KDH_01160 [Dictyobacter sp. S3.2.2.5]